MEIVLSKKEQKLGGVYKIKNIKNGKIYIGSTNNFIKRARQHKGSLVKQVHFNKHLQNSYNNNGANKFVFSVLEIVDGDMSERTKIEQAFLNKVTNWNLVYNKKKKVIQKHGEWSSNPKITKKKLSDHFKKMWASRNKEEKEKICSYARSCRTEETFKKIALAQIGKFVSEETKEKIRVARKRQNSYWFNRKFSKKHKHNISKALKGKNCGKKSYMHGKIAELHPTSKQYNIKLISPEGNSYGPFVGLNNFCKIHNLTPQHIYAVANGKRSSHKGWKLLKTTNL